jgi:hypothetical protein
MKELPDWLKKLPPGEYSLEGIFKHTKDICTSNIYNALQSIGVERVKKKKKSDYKPIYYYNWKGASYYYLRLYETRIKKLWGNCG